jgi:putative acetyltransferase
LNITVRSEQSADIPAIREINQHAFAGTQEADIVDALRQSCAELVSLVAVVDGRPVGHILFSPVVIESPGGEVRGMGLGPLAVLPDYQRQGIGSHLIRSGLDIVKHSSSPFVIVLGHSGYYPRFGFERASLYGVHSQWLQVPDEAFMLLVIDKQAMKGVSGTAFYRQEFDSSM